MSPMNTHSLQPAPSPFLAAQPRREIDAASQTSFASVLSQSQNTSLQAPTDQARTAAEQFVAISLVQPILKQFRDSSQAAPPFAPTQGEKQFQSLADAQLAERLVRAQRFPLVDRLAETLRSRAEHRIEVTP